MRAQLPPGWRARYRHERAYTRRHGVKMSEVVEGLSEKGGRTTVQVFNRDDELVVTAVARCSPRDNFSRKIGRDVALGRALKALWAGDLFYCRCGTGHPFGATCAACGEDYYDSPQMAEASRRARTTRGLPSHGTSGCNPLEEDEFTTQAVRAYAQGDGGWYVVNALTLAPLRGPYETKRLAQVVASTHEPPVRRVVYAGLIDDGSPR